MSSKLIEVAIEICTRDEFKSKIFSGVYTEGHTEIQIKKDWDKNVKLVATNLMTHHELVDFQKEKVIGFVFSIALRMLTWIEYQIGTFQLSREFCLSLLEPGLFTPEGIMDYNKVADGLIGTKFSNMQDFQLACYYCRKLVIQKRYKALTDEEKKTVFDDKRPGNICQLDLVKIWPFYFLDRLELLIAKEPEESESELRKVKKEKLPFQHYVRVSAAKCASKVAVELFSTNTADITYSAVALVVERAKMKYMTDRNKSGFVDDWVVFGQEKYNFPTNWVPEHFYVDTFYSLLTKLKPADKMEVVRSVFVQLNEVKSFREIGYPKVFENFLRWPYIKQFLELLKCSWKLLPVLHYAAILLEVVDRIDADEGDYWYGESTIYNYRRYLMDVWSESPIEYKETIISGTLKRPKVDIYAEETEIKIGTNFLIKLLNIRNFNSEDSLNVSLILNSVDSYESKLNFLKFEETLNIFLRLLKSGIDSDRKLVEDIVARCCSTPSEAYKFKKSLSFNRNVCLEHLKNERWEDAERALKWFEMSDMDLVDVKREVLSCQEGRRLCREICMRDPSKAERYVQWAFHQVESEDYFQLDENTMKYKWSLLQDEEGIEDCEKALLQDLLEQVNRLISWCLSEEDVAKLKRSLLSKHVRTACLANFDCDYAAEFMINNPGALITQIVKWDQVSKLLNWCFSTEPEMEEYKQQMIKGESGDIISKFIGSDKWVEAEKFLQLLNLSPDKEKEFKRDNFFESESTSVVFDELMQCEENDARFEQYNGKKAAIEKFLRFYMVDKEAVSEFKAIYGFYSKQDEVKNVLSLIEQDFQK